MYIEPFAVEEWMNAYEGGAKYNIAETCAESMSVKELLALAGKDEGEFMREFLTHRDYDHISFGMLDERVAALAVKNKDAIFARNRGIVRENLAILDEWIKGEREFGYVKPSAGMTALVYYNYDIPSYRFARELYEREGVFVTPGDCFGEPKCFRIGYACNKNTLVAGLKGLSAYAETL